MHRAKAVERRSYRWMYCDWWDYKGGGRTVTTHDLRDGAVRLGDPDWGGTMSGNWVLSTLGKHSGVKPCQKTLHNLPTSHLCSVPRALAIYEAMPRTPCSLHSCTPHELSLPPVRRANTLSGCSYSRPYVQMVAIASGRRGRNSLDRIQDPAFNRRHPIGPQNGACFAQGGWERYVTLSVG